MNYPFEKLSIRAQNVLCNLDIKNRDEALEAFQSGKLNPRSTMNGTRCYGWKTHKEVADWLGLPEPNRLFVRSLQCPHCQKDLKVTITAI